ncbi:MAG: hypothetical protein ACRELB_12840, partial [Polyangiaceae bacterium]
RCRGARSTIARIFMLRAYAIPAANVRPDSLAAVAVVALPVAALAAAVTWLVVRAPDPDHAAAWAALAGAVVGVALCAHLRQRSIVRALAFKVVLDDKRLISERPPHASVEIGRAEMGPVREVAGRGMLVFSRDERRAIFVPAAVEGYDDLRGRLAGWRPIERMVPAPRAALAGTVALVVAMGALAVEVFSMRPALVEASGAVVLLASGAGLIAVGLDPRPGRARSGRAIRSLLPALLALWKMALVLRAR